MGKRGPTPTPTETLKRRGSDVPRKRRSGEPKPDSNVPTSPAHLTAAEHEVFDDLCGKLSHMGLLSKTDEAAISRYAHLWAEWTIVCGKLHDQGSVYALRDNNGDVKCLMPSPYIAIRNKLNDQLLRLEQNFGLTPSARAGLSTATPQRDEATDTLGDILRFPGKTA